MNFSKLAVTLVSALVFSTSQAESYPDRPITIVVPFAPGGSGDVLARLVGQKLSDAIGESVIIDNRAGASGAIGANAVSRATPDGYTLLLADDSILSILPLLNTTTADYGRDLTPIIASPR